ncbi:unnamed protein product [Penicillium salamii]|uniref:Uncharacterized protein n=1 Tax=Penicillium salamii TaxID=1612424 RepID=A0A9W4J954_9EURO|nr:unnamed protein product [Penicillium salamii]CAG7984704.1 unnamed protein product [Penicillium salamii]CAG8079213.1 unnamed protein product [Penicillium salamii]CAG8087062.1 unnamed protein product [Penicillium salamii]CAG8092017.1 unnamed protein product [Penicillium salamii]
MLTENRLVDSCVGVMKKGLQKCRTDDWDCKCSGAANIANCYVNCSEDDEAGASARSLSVGNCATANAFDQGETTVAPSWTRPGSNAAQPTNIDADPTSGASSSVATGATKSLNEHEKSTSSEGAASMNVAGSWLALVGLGLGIAI